MPPGAPSRAASPPAPFSTMSPLFLEQKGAALRYPSRFMEYALDRKRRALSDRLALLARCDLLRHLPPEEMAPLLDRVRTRSVKAGESGFHAGHPGDALYLVADGSVQVIAPGTSPRILAELGSGQAFGEMALLSGGSRTATVAGQDRQRASHHREGGFRSPGRRRSVPRRAGTQAQP